ncbi:hypothetical protein EVAR_16228_1 [Eumeta japonica]|uniref:Uncharacterized protein n=1 Tax=Eumeta variegata TaxID=151549 RepID=A0A4C1U5Y4_EUMVA|nr:hypothetical protein EVAR_16228_1 [Eumeta japonica]
MARWFDAEDAHAQLIYGARSLPQPPSSIIRPSGHENYDFNDMPVESMCFGCGENNIAFSDALAHSGRRNYSRNTFADITQMSGLIRGKRALRSSESRWSPPPIDTHNPRGVISVLPVVFFLNTPLLKFVGNSADERVTPVVMGRVTTFVADGTVSEARSE